MTWKPPIPMTSVLILSFLLVLSGPALEGCQSASVGDTAGAKPPETSEEHESSRIYKNAGKVSKSTIVNAKKILFRRCTNYAVVMLNHEYFQLSDKDHGHFHDYEDVHDVGDGEHR